jgi:superfamily II DNA or RNA helicase
MPKNLFDFNFNISLPDQGKFPLNEAVQGRTVKEIIVKDLSETEEYLIITGFTSISNLIEMLGYRKFPLLKKVRVVIGWDPDERVSKKLPHYSLPIEVRNFWVKQNVSIKLCGPIINMIQLINEGSIEFRSKDKLHAKIYVGDTSAILGSSNFSKTGILTQSEANIRVLKKINSTENQQYESIKQIGEYYFNISNPYNEGFIELLNKLLKDATWQEAVARAIAEILESKWMKDYPALYQALVSNELWPSQKIGIARAMTVIQDQGRVLIADPTGSGKTKFATALAYTLFHWLWENGLKDKSNALIIAPKQVTDNWAKEQNHFKLYNKIESMSKLSMGKGKNVRQLLKEVEEADILVVDEAHNYLRKSSQRSQAINPKGSTHIILSTATPINKKAEDLLRLIELLDIDNLNDEDLKTFIDLRMRNNRDISKHLDVLQKYINQFIVRRTKKELNRMIDREEDLYKNHNQKNCRYPNMISEVYDTGETELDKAIARKIILLIGQLKGVHYLQKIRVPAYYESEEDKKHFVEQRFRSAPALAAFMVRSALRSSDCALMEYLEGTLSASREYQVKTSKKESGNIIAAIVKCSLVRPVILFPDDWVPEEGRWLITDEGYAHACANEINCYEQIAGLCRQLSGAREQAKVHKLMECASRFQKIIAFDSTVITLDYLNKLLDSEGCEADILVATGQPNSNRDQVKERMALGAAAGKDLIALCSDAMSEGINLQGGQALVLLDMPSVLRIIEQRIGRIERMDSEHKEIFVYWPNDSDEFSLNGDRRMIDILVMTDNLIGNNVEIPQALYDRYLKDGITVKKLMDAYREYSENEMDWEGVKDSTQYLYELIDEKDGLIDQHTYDLYKDVDASVKTAISFIETGHSWSFFAFRGDMTRSPKWLFIDSDQRSTMDFGKISTKLKEYLGATGIVQRRWEEVNTDKEIRKLVHKLRAHERKLLPCKKGRALEVGLKILHQIVDKQNPLDPQRRQLIERLFKLFKQDPEMDDSIDYSHFADLWLTLLVPRLDELRRTKMRKRKIYTLKDLTFKEVNLTDEQLEWLFTNCQYTSTLDEIVASCIISLKKTDA